jgi:hypothetical protein
MPQRGWGDSGIMPTALKPTWTVVALIAGPSCPDDPDRFRVLLARLNRPTAKLIALDFALSYPI